MIETWPDDTRLLTAREVAQRLGVSPGKIAGYARLRLIPAYRAGDRGPWRFRWHEVIAAMQVEE